LAVAEVDKLELMSPTMQAAWTFSLEFASMFTLQVYNITSLNFTLTANRVVQQCH